MSGEYEKQKLEGSMQGGYKEKVFYLSAFSFDNGYSMSGMYDRVHSKAVINLMMDNAPCGFITGQLETIKSLK